LQRGVKMAYPVSGSNRESVCVTLWREYGEHQRCSGIYLMSFSARKLIENPAIGRGDMVAGSPVAGSPVAGDPVGSKGVDPRLVSV
jgi:hypothetical protein